MIFNSSINIALYSLILLFSSVNSKADYWKGTIGGQTNIALEIVKTEDNQQKVTFYNLDANYSIFSADSVSLANGNLNCYFKSIGAQIYGSLGSQKDSLQLTWVIAGKEADILLGKWQPDSKLLQKKNLVAKGMHPMAPIELGQFAFLIGEWHGHHEIGFPNGQSQKRLLIWKGEWVLEGLAIQNESRTYIMKDSINKGRMVQLGQDTRIYRPNKSKWEHVYTDAFSDMILNISWTKEGDELVSSPTKWGGATHIIRFRNISDTAFDWVLDRSIDDGANWVLDFQVIKNKRVK